MNKYFIKHLNNLQYFYNGREVEIIKYLKLIDTVIINFKDNEKELRSVKRSCLEISDKNYKSFKFLRVSQLSTLY